MRNSNVRPCPACDGVDRKSIGTKNRFEIFSCSGCSTLYTGQIPAFDETMDYDEYYSEANLIVPGFIQNRLLEIFNGFGSYRETNRLLDIGFGAGTTLEVAAKLKWDVFGLEVSRPAVNHARKRGFEVFHGSLREAGYPDGHFDVITSSEILEHLTDPNGDLHEIARILRPGGLFWATTPSATGLSFRLMKLAWSVLSPPEHIQLYSIKGVRIMFQKAGFSYTDLKTTGLNPIEIANYYRPRPVVGEAFDRVQTAYQLNEGFSKSLWRTRVKGILNGTLNLIKMGDSLKICARTK